MRKRDRSTIGGDASTALLVRQAIEHYGGGFGLMQAVRKGDRIVDWIVLDANRFVADRWRRPRSQLKGKLVSSFGGGIDNESFAELHRKALATGAPQEGMTAVAALGQSAQRHVTVVPVAPDVVATFTRDSNAHVEVQARALSLVERNWDIVVVTDAEGHLTWVSPAVESSLGYRPTDLEGRAAWELIHPDDVTAIQERFLEVVAGAEEGEPIELRVLLADGSSRWFECIGANLLDDPILHGLVVSLHDIDARHRTERALERMAHYDDLTGLPNRRLLVRRLEDAVAAARASGRAIGVLCIELDDFKLVNDTLGHDVGDELLALVGERISSALGDGAILGRPAGAEFVVLSEVGAKAADLEELATRVSSVLRDPFAIRGRQVFVTASIGMAVSNGAGEPSVELLRQADTALHRAKRRGQAQIEVFDRKMQAELTARLDHQSALQLALNRDEFVAHYQPIVELATDRVTRIEALIRWRRPGLGLVPPSDFIELAEETGLIVPIGEWMVRRATRDAAAWQTSNPGVGVAVNVSARQIDSPDFVGVVADAVESAGLDPGLLTLEITESVLLGDTQQVLAVLDALRHLGVRVALDDFGTGYSSLTYLRRLAIDDLKIDQSFLGAHVTGPAGDPLLGFIIELGRELGLEVVAEGVDSEAKREALIRLGCVYGQGFLFARPTPLRGPATWR